MGLAVSHDNLRVKIIPIQGITHAGGQELDRRTIQGANPDIAAYDLRTDRAAILLFSPLYLWMLNVVILHFPLQSFSV